MNLLELFKLPGNDFQCPNVLGYTQFKTNHGEFRYRISLMSALSRWQFKAVCAHEFTHCWIFENVAPQRKQALGRSAEEGFCELMAYLLMSSQNETKEMDAITHNNYSRGQIDLFIEAEKRYGFNEIVDWMKFGVDAELDRSDLNKLRHIEIAQPPARPATNVMVYAAVSTPAPETLVLRGISWIRTQPLAVINDRTFAVGESGKVRLGKSNVVIRCLAIETNSARIQILQGPREELKLKFRE